MSLKAHETYVRSLKTRSSSDPRSVRERESHADKKKCESHQTRVLFINVRVIFYKSNTSLWALRWLFNFKRSLRDSLFEVHGESHFLADMRAFWGGEPPHCGWGSDDACWRSMSFPFWSHFVSEIFEKDWKSSKLLWVLRSFKKLWKLKCEFKWRRQSSKMTVERLRSIYRLFNSRDTRHRSRVNLSDTRISERSLRSDGIYVQKHLTRLSCFKHNSQPWSHHNIKWGSRLKWGSHLHQCESHVLSFKHKEYIFLLLQSVQQYTGERNWWLH